MSDTLEKIYCTGQDNTALISALANKQDPMATAALMNGGGMGGWNNPFIYLVWMMFANRMWNNEGANNPVINSQLDALRTQMSDNQNSNQLMNAITGNGSDLRTLASQLNCDFNTLQTAICSVKSAIESVGGAVGFNAERVINAVNLGDQNITSKLCECCCNTQQSILRMGYENQLATERQTNILSSQMASNHSADTLQDCQYHGQTMSRIDQLANGIQQGFASLGYQANSDKCDIINAINASQQKTNDLLTSHWQLETSQALQDAKNEISQLKQTQYLANLMNGGCGCGSVNLQ